MPERKNATYRVSGESATYCAGQIKKEFPGVRISRIIHPNRPCIIRIDFSDYSNPQDVKTRLDEIVYNRASIRDGDASRNSLSRPKRHLGSIT